MTLLQTPCAEYRGFECPVCGYRRYCIITVTRPGKKPYPTDFYGCLGCSAMFTDPYRFTQSKRLREEAKAAAWGDAETDDRPEWSKRIGGDTP